MTKLNNGILAISMYIIFLLIFPYNLPQKKEFLEYENPHYFFFFFINSCYFFPGSVYIRLIKERATLKGKKSIFQAILNLIFSVPQISRASHRHYWPRLIWVHTILVIYTVWRGYRWSVYMYVCAVTILICCTIADETSLENWPCLSLL